MFVYDFAAPPPTRLTWLGIKKMLYALVQDIELENAY